MADPFAQTPQAPAAPGAGFLGIPASSWQNLQNFGANMAVAANARDPNGFLTYGGGLAGPLGEATIQTQQQVAQKQAQLAQQGLVGAEAQGQQIQNMMNELALPKAAMLSKLYQDPAALNNFIQTGQMAAPSDQQGAQPQPQPQDQSYAAPMGGGAPGRAAYPQQQTGPATAAGTTQNAPGSEGMDGYLQTIAGIESKGNVGARNAQGYSGLFGQGAGALADAGVYAPAKGEDLSKNVFQGTFNIPGYEPMSYAQFMVNPQAQVAAAKMQEAKNWQDIQANHLDYMIGQNVGGVQLTQPALLGMVHIGGLQGAMQFIQSGGKYNPPDANGTTIGAYANQVNAGMYQYYQNQGKAPPPQYDPSRSVNPQDVPGPFIPSGGVTSGKAQQEVDQLSQQMQRMQLLGLPTDGIKARISMLSPMAQAPYQNVTMRPGGGSIVNGNFVKMSSPDALVSGGGASMPGAEYGGYSVNGQEQSPAQVSLAQQPNQAPGPTSPPPSGPPNQQNLSIPQFGKPPSPKTDSDMAFDAAVMGQPMPQPVGSGGPMYTKVLPGVEETMDSGTKELIKDQDEAQDNAKIAIQGNALLSNMQNESKSWTSDVFANWHNDVRKVMLGIADNLGIPAPNMSEKVGDFATWYKNSQQFVMQAVHATSSRASQQEYQMIAQSLPNATIGNNALTQITAELKGVNDYKIAYNQAMSNWRKGFAGMSPDQQYIQTLGGFDGAFNQRITPYAFMVHALTETPEGMQQFHTMVQNMQQTPQGRSELGRLQAQWQYAQQAGLFSASGGGTGG